MREFPGDSISGEGRRPREVTGRVVLVCLVAFFAAVTAVNAVMITAAVSTFGGVETASAYQAGFAFAQETAAAVAQDALHWQVKARVSSRADATVIEIVATDAAERPLADLQAVARLVHPTDRRADHIVPLHETASGGFEGAIGEVVGRWALEIELWRGGTRMFRSKNRVFLR
jgi:nitrogen fixation protein FixH